MVAAGSCKTWFYLLIFKLLCADTSEQTIRGAFPNMLPKILLGIFCLVILANTEEIPTEGAEEWNKLSTGKWELEFEKETFTGEGDPPEVWVKSFDPNTPQNSIVGESHIRKTKCKKVRGLQGNFSSRSKEALVFYLLP